MKGPCFSKGDEVRHKNRRHSIGVVVDDPRLIDGEYWYRVRFGDRSHNVREEELEPASAEKDLLTLLCENAWGGKETLSKIVTFNKLRHPLSDVIYSFRASRTEFHAYQFKPLLKLLDSPTGRLLIADEVGLGKTIEAGYILQELRARSVLNRVLIVCPSSLRQKWRDEMWNRFDERFEILNAAGVRQLLDRLEEEGPGGSFRVIVSLQTLRGSGGAARPNHDVASDWESRSDQVPSLLDLFEAAAPPLDLVIVDEAHHMRNTGTNSHRLGQVLSDVSDIFLMLTATPIHIGSQNLFNLLRILDPAEFENLQLFDQRIQVNQYVVKAERLLRRQRPADLQACRDMLRSVEETAEARRYLTNPFYRDVLDKLLSYDGGSVPHVTELQRDLGRINTLGHVFTRTRKREVQENRPKRAPSVIRPNWSVQEASFYEEITEYCRQRYAACHGQVIAEFAVINLQRQMASCIPAMFERLPDLENVPAPPQETVDAEEPFQDSTDYTSTEFTGIREDPEFLGILLEWRGEIQKDSKFEALLETLQMLWRQEPGKKLIIFSYFKRTLAYLSKRLAAAGIRCELIHGDIPSRPMEPHKDERGNRLRRFREDPASTVLLSSEVGSEGLDFQFCHALVNYDLPWNPMVVEQRIGRLDRLGQKSPRILIFNFAIPDTIEDRILTRLYYRIRIFEDTIGDLEPIIGDEIRRLTHDILRTHLSPEELDALIDERAQALEMKRQNEKELEEASGRFVSQDQYFIEEIERIQNRTRFLSADELETYVVEFLEWEFPRRMWRPSGRPRCFDLKWTEDLDTFVRDHHNVVERAELDFFQRAYHRTLRVTCDAGAATEDTSLELLTATHPFIRAIVRHYEDKPDRLHPLAAVRVAAADVDPGDYVYFLFLINATGARPTRQLVALVLDTEAAPVDDERAESLLMTMITRGDSLGTGPEVPPDVAKRLYDAALLQIKRRIDRQREKLERLNEALASQRLESFRSSYQSKRGKWVYRLERANARGGKPNYIRMIEGTLRRMDIEFEQKKRNLDAESQLDLTWDCFAAGVVRVERKGS